VKIEMFRSDPEIFDVWAEFTTAGDRLAGFAPAPPVSDAESQRSPAAHAHSVDDGLQLIRNGRALVFYIVRARTSMPKSTREFVERCAFYRQNGRLPAMPVVLPG